MVEQYAAIVLKKMLTNDDPGYVDLTSPAGIGIGAIVYNYDGDVYASDEGRMLAEMGDTTFRLGNLHADSYEEIMLSEALLAPAGGVVSPRSAPMCTDCAFEPYCGADPTYHHATAGTSSAASRPRRSIAATWRSSGCCSTATKATARREPSSGPGRAIDRAARKGDERAAPRGPLPRAVWQLVDAGR